MISIAAFALIAFQGTTPPAKPAPDAVLATLDGKPFTAAEVEPYLWAWKAREVITELAYYRTTDAEAAKKGVSVTDAEVKAKLDEQIAKLKTTLPAGQTVDTFLQSKGVNLPHVALAVRNGLLVDKLAALDFKPDNFVKVDTLLFATNGATTDALKGPIKSADTAYASLAAGKAWDAVVKTSSTPAAGTAQGATLGWKSVDVFPENVRTQFATMKPLGFTKPTQTPYGIQIFRLDLRGKDATPAEMTDLKTQYVANARKAIDQRLRETAAKVEFK